MELLMIVFGELMKNNFEGKKMEIIIEDNEWTRQLIEDMDPFISSVVPVSVEELKS